LFNQHGSSRYNAFVDSLGWTIDVLTHAGYRGKLEMDASNGAFATYYCTDTVEMLFHDVVRMPTDPNDPQQVKKKRHIGNDHVHIVWNEHARRYRPTTIKGDFGNAQIVITPLDNGLYGIDVYKDNQLESFGPLFNGGMVSAAALPSLVRVTAIRAFRSCFYSMRHVNRHAFAQRAKDLQFIYNRHRSTPCTFEQFMNRLFI
jgi:hypothetical protein